MMIAALLLIALGQFAIAFLLLGIWLDIPSRKFTMLQQLRQARALEWLASSSARMSGQPAEAELQAMRAMSAADLARADQLAHLRAQERTSNE